MMRFERCTNAQLIPRYLLEQLPDNYDVDRFYEFMLIALSSPTQMLFLLLSEEDIICGFLWCEINLLDEVMFINTFSVDKELWGKGAMVDFATDFLKTLFNKLNLKKAVWITDKPTLFEKRGFKKSKNFLIEYTGE